MTDTKRTGGCLCGTVRYETTGEPATQMVCHCKVCQKTSGSALSTIALFPRAQVTVTAGELKGYAYKSDTENDMQINFCPDCGSPVLLDIKAMPDLVSVKIGTMDDTHWFHPVAQIWTDSKQDWIPLAEDVPAVPKQ